MSLATWMSRMRDEGRRVPNSVNLVFLLFALDGILFISALATVLGLGDMSTAGVEIFGSSYAFDTPLFPWVLGALGGLSVAAAWSAAQLRRFPFVMGVALVWLALAIGVIATGSGPGLLVERVILIAALLKGRHAFVG